MLKGYEILKTIPAYDFSDSKTLITKEEQEKYIKQTSKDNKKIVRRIVKEILNKYKNNGNARFVLSLILDNPHLLNKTKLAFDGSYRNMRVCVFDDYGRNYIGLRIDWENATGKKISNNDYFNFYDSIVKEDIIEVLNNIEEIFIQP